MLKKKEPFGVLFFSKNLAYRTKRVDENRVIGQNVLMKTALHPCISKMWSSSIFFKEL